MSRIKDYMRMHSGEMIIVGVMGAVLTVIGVAAGMDINHALGYAHRR